MAKSALSHTCSPEPKPAATSQRLSANVVSERQVSSISEWSPGINGESKFEPQKGPQILDDFSICSNMFDIWSMKLLGYPLLTYTQMEEIILPAITFANIELGIGRVAGWGPLGIHWLVRFCWQPSGQGLEFPKEKTRFGHVWTNDQGFFEVNMGIQATSSRHGDVISTNQNFSDHLRMVLVLLAGGLLDMTPKWQCY